MDKLNQSIIKAQAYGQGLVPVPVLPPYLPHESRSGFCDYCNQKRPVLIPTEDMMYFVCWKCVCSLRELWTEDWQSKVKSRLFANRQGRLQLAAQRLNNKKEGGSNFQFVS